MILTDISFMADQILWLRLKYVKKVLLFRMQQVVPFIIPKTRKELVRHQVDVQAKFYGELHRHEELQLSIIRRGVGTLIAADFVGPFQAGDIFLIGANVPHVFHSKPEPDASHSHMETLFFDFRLLQDLAEIVPGIFDSMLHADIWQGVYRIRPDFGIIAHFDQWSELQAREAFLRALGLLETLFTHSKKMEPLHQNADLEASGWASTPRIREVMKYTIDRFTQPITLEEVASLAHMSKGAFCRYFKKHTRKTYLEFLKEVRLQHAAQLLKQGNYSVTEVAFASGFNHLSYFNRLFKAYFGKTPRQFAKD